MNRINQVKPGKGTHRRSRGVQQGDEEQRPTGTDTGILYPRHGKEAHDHVGQTGGTTHQCSRDKEHVNRGFGTIGVGRKAQIGDHLIQLVKKIDTGIVTGRVQHGGTETCLRQHMASHHDGQEDRRHQESKDQHAILGHLGVGNPFHAAQHRVEENDGHTDHHTGIDIHFQETGKHDTGTTHLPGHVGERNEDHADHCHGSRHIGVVAVTDKIRHRKFAEFSQIGRQQHGQQYITASPPHQVDRRIVTRVGNDPRHGNKRGGGHPVRCRCCAVGNGRHPTTGHIKVFG